MRLAAHERVVSGASRSWRDEHRAIVCATRPPSSATACGLGSAPGLAAQENTISGASQHGGETKRTTARPSPRRDRSPGPPCSSSQPRDAITAPPPRHRHGWLRVHPRVWRVAIAARGAHAVPSESRGLSPFPSKRGCRARAWRPRCVPPDAGRNHAVRATRDSPSLAGGSTLLGSSVLLTTCCDFSKLSALSPSFRHQQTEGLLLVC
jgi:hypothetical protein